MNVIFSRKGFDDKYGEMPSPIIDDQPISLPIPYENSDIKFEDRGLGQIVENLSNNRIQRKMSCHPDPDLEMGAFGQVDKSQTHLKNEGVGNGDLFLFFGTFREAVFNGKDYEWVRGSPKHHRIFGWLFVEDAIQVGSNPTNFRNSNHKYSNHPHANNTWGNNNTIYIAPETFTPFNRRTLKGFGKFKATEDTLLSTSSYYKSHWKIPNWLNELKGGCGMSYHEIANYYDNNVETAKIGQEFVSKPKQTQDFQDWLINLFDTST